MPLRIIVLASTSPYRKSLLRRLPLIFDVIAPNVDESPRVGESPQALVERLSLLKAEAARTAYPDALVIGSDQVAVLEGRVLGKPETHERAVAQLTAMSGKRVDFLTGLCLLNTATGEYERDTVGFAVYFRSLTLLQIEAYLLHDKPYHCAGSFRSEGLGIALVERMEGGDSTALLGLPLIRLIEMFEKAGLTVL